MNEVLKLMQKFLSRGWATKQEKAELESKVDELDTEEQETVADELETVNDLPETEVEATPSEGGEEADEDVDETEVEKSLKTMIKSAAGEAVVGLKKEVRDWLSEQQDLKAKKAGIYAPSVTRARKRMNEYTRSFISSILSGDATALKGMHDEAVRDHIAKGISKKELSTDASGSPYGGYLVDSELSAEVRHLTTEYGVARREMEALQLTKHNYKANDLATDVTVGWVDEGSAISSKQVVLGQETLELKKLGVIVSMTNELLEDSEIDLASFVASRVAEKFAQAEDEAFFKGDGTSTYGSFTGLLEASDVNEVTMTGSTFASIDADDLIDMVDATPQGAQKNGKFYMHRTIMSYIRKLKDSQNQYIYQAPSASGPATVWGYPVVLVEAMPSKTDTAAETSFVLFGDLKKACIFGYKGAIRAEQFNAGVIRNVANSADINLITTDRRAIRWIERVGYIRIIPTAVTKLTTAAASA